MSKFKQGSKEMLSICHYAYRRTIQTLPALIALGTPYVCMLLLVYGYKLQATTVITLAWLLPPILLLLALLVRCINRASQECLGDLPVARKRFTHRDAFGKVIFSMNDLYEMVEYVAEIEEYCKKYKSYSYGGKENG